MPALEPPAEADLRSDADIITAIREGDNAAIDELYRRHNRAALAFADSVAGRTLAPDLVSDAFVRIIDLLKRGGGPTLVFRSYLYTTIRNLYVDHVRHHSRQTSLGDFGPLEGELALGDGVDEQFEASLVKKAFASLPERWQVALWYTTVEGVSLEDAGRFLGVAPNAVAALTFRAREGLRQAYLAEHLQMSVNQTCVEVWEVLPKYVRGGLRARKLETVETHLPGCRTCSAAVLELGEVNSNLRGVLLLALLGAGTAGYLDQAIGHAALASAQAAALAPAKGLVHGISRFGRAAAAVGAAAAAGVLVIAWPHHGAPGSSSGHRPTAPRLTQPTSSASAAAPPGAVTSHPGATGSTKAPATARSVSVGAPSTATETRALGPADATRLTKTTPTWYHVVVPIQPPTSGADGLTLVIEGTSWVADHVHTEPGYGPWSCSIGANRTTLRCHLPAGVTGTLDLGLDVQLEGSSTLDFTVSIPGGDLVSTLLTVG